MSRRFTRPFGRRDFSGRYDTGSEPPVPDERDEELRRVEHPTVPAPRFKCYRVVRHYRQYGELHYEDLGGFPTPLPAVQMLTRERWRARILDPLGKTYADNWRPIEERA